MAAARIWPGKSILASDIDDVAVDVARANLQANDMDGHVQCVQAAGFAHPDLQAAIPYDLIFANILKGPLVALAPEVSANLKPGGYAILSGILADQADNVTTHYVRAGTNLVHSEQIGDWMTLVFRKMA